jgi:DNA mismatch repair protein MutL
MPEPSASAAARRSVRVLPEALSNQIAAGEVVERPASVVKELVENALDAGATRVSVEISESARDLCVVDDGSGMAREDAVLALSRFATSKIVSLDDLHRIGTYGFRGEALPSIASVSRLTLETRTADGEGTRIEVAGGETLSVKPAGAPPGTKVLVEELFYNTPARLKFLKTSPTEVRAAIQACAHIAIPADGVGFKVTVAGTKVPLQVAPFATRLERIAAVLGPEVAKESFPFEGSSGGIRVTGYAGSPAIARSNARDLWIYVNGRTVKDRTVQAAAIEAYRSLLPSGRYPVAVILIEAPASLVDVNVHPAKTEVRFAKSDDLWRSVHRGIEAALREAPWARGAGGARVPVAVPMTFGAAGSAAIPAPPWIPASPPAPGQAGEAPRVYTLLRDAPSAAVGPATVPIPTGDDPRTFFRSVRVFGQYKATYLLGERNGELVVIDQHAAHERVMFERLRTSGATAGTQRLLVPAIVERTAAEMKGVEEILPLLARAGIEAEPFGETSLAVRAVPAVLGKVDPSKLLKDALDEIDRHGRSGTLLDRIDDVYARMACHAAVRAGDPLSSEEAARLLADMDGIDFASNCPHGRPVVVRFPWTEVEKWFERR